MMYRISSAVTYLSLFQFLHTIIPLKSQQCKELGDECIEDCECCGFDDNPTVRCERRTKRDGNRCYISGGLGSACTQHSDCKSQFCLNGICAPNTLPRYPYTVWKCPLPIVHTHKKGGNFIGGCGNGLPMPTDADAAKATDGSTGTYYISQRALNGGIRVQLNDPHHHGALKQIRICNSECVECDPTSYKLEGKCFHTGGIFELVQEGPISFTSPNSCVDIHVGSSLYVEYQIYFPTQRGGCTENCNGEIQERSCPLKLSEIEFRSDCRLIDPPRYPTKTCATRGCSVDVIINTDARPGQISWELLDSNDNRMAHGGGYPGSPWQRHETNLNTICGHLYTLKMVDSGLDGFQCNKGDCGYEIWTEGEKIVQDWGFRNEIEHTFELKCP